MTPEQTAMRSKAEQRLAETFERLGDPDPQETARRAVQELVDAGWRPSPALADKPGSARRSTKEGRAAARRLYAEVREQQKTTGGAA